MEEEFKPWGQDTKTFCMLMHLSQLASMVVPVAGIVLPIVMWATNKDQSLEIDNHGRVILNWLISAIIYSVISLFLMLVFIGFFTIFAVALLNIIFIIIGAVKANDGELWVYPLSIGFFSLKEY